MKFDVKKYIFLLVAGLLAFGAVVGTVVSTSNNGAVLLAQEQKIQQLKGSVAIKEAEVEKAKSQTNQGASGIDAARKAKDDELIKQVLGTAFTWNSYESYMAGRTKLMTGFGIKEDSTMLTKTMPSVENRTDPSGKTFNVIDTQGLNSSFASVESRVSLIKVTDYSYFAIAKANTSSKVGSTSVETSYAVSYTIDANGKLLDIKVDAVPEVTTTGD